MRALTVFFMIALVAPANAWDKFKMFEDPTTGPTSGGGGVWGTGARRDGAVTCAHCHVKGPGKTYGQITFFPLLNEVAGNSLYRPNQRYQVTVTMKDESLGRNFGLCALNATSMNGFAAAFETITGVRVGRLESDSGQDSSACPATVPDLQPGSTVTYGKCGVISSTDKQDQTAWSFWWTAPPKGAGKVVMYWGLVDGNCNQRSTGDDVKMGTVLMAEGQP